MTPRQKNLALYTAAAVCGVGAIACAAWAVLAPVEVDPPAIPPHRNARAATTTTAPAGLPPLAAFENVWSLPLRKPLTGPATTANVTPAPPDVPPPNPAASVPLTLLGTIGDSTAILRTQAGAVEVKSVGDTTAGVKILSVRPSQVEVDFNGQRVLLSKPKDPL